MTTTPDRARDPEEDPLLQRIRELDASEVESLRLPDKVGPYLVEGVLGEGGMGLVLRARQPPPLDRPVALKLTRAAALSDRNLERFHREMMALARLDHPNIVRIFDAGRSERGEPYFVMDLVEDALPLDRHVQKWNPGLPERLVLFQDVLHGVAHAHERGVLHRDLKPGNILVTRVNGMARARLIDFGVARIVDESGAEGTRTGETPGTPSFMAPELFLDRSAASERSDVFSLGVILYQLLTGRHPFHPTGDGDSDLAEAMKRRLTRPPRRPSRLAPPRERRPSLDAVVLRALHVDPGKRYSTVAALESAITEALARPRGAWERRLVLMLLATAIAASGLWWWCNSWQEEDPRKSPFVLESSELSSEPSGATADRIRSLLVEVEPLEFGAREVPSGVKRFLFKRGGTVRNLDVEIPTNATHLLMGPVERVRHSKAFLRWTTNGLHVRLEANALEGLFVRVPIRHLPPGAADEHGIGIHPVLVFPGTIGGNDFRGDGTQVRSGETLEQSVGSILVPRDRVALVEDGGRILRLLPGFHDLPTHGFERRTVTRVQSMPLELVVDGAEDRRATKCPGMIVFAHEETSPEFGKKLWCLGKKEKGDEDLYKFWEGGFGFTNETRAIYVEEDQCARLFSSKYKRNDGIVLGPGFYGTEFLKALELDKAIDRVRPERFLPHPGDEDQLETYTVRFPHG